MLEIGFGGGALIDEGLRRFPGTRFTGADISALAVSRANRTFARFVEAGTVDFVHLGGGALPFDECRFDTVVSVNVVYFVADLEDQTREIFRVLAPDGTGRGQLCRGLTGRDDKVSNIADRDIAERDGV